MITVLENYITQEQADEILNKLQLSFVKVKKDEWPNELGDYLMPKVPEHLKVIMAKLHEDGYFVEHPDAVTIHEYLLQQSIEPHIDDVTYGDVTAVVTVKGTCDIFFGKGEETLSYTLNPKSVIIFSGEHRTDWTHWIPPVSEVRISLVIRKQKV